MVDSGEGSGELLQFNWDEDKQAPVRKERIMKEKLRFTGTSATAHTLHFHSVHIRYKRRSLTEIDAKISVNL